MQFILSQLEVPRLAPRLLDQSTIKVRLHGCNEGGDRVGGEAQAEDEKKG